MIHSKYANLILARPTLQASVSVDVSRSMETDACWGESRFSF